MNQDLATIAIRCKLFFSLSFPIYVSSNLLSSPGQTPPHLPVIVSGSNTPSISILHQPLAACNFLSGSTTATIYPMSCCMGAGRAVLCQLVIAVVEAVVCSSLIDAIFRPSDINNRLELASSDAGGFVGYRVAMSPWPVTLLRRVHTQQRSFSHSFLPKSHCGY
jgi:hypothetical protein